MKNQYHTPTVNVERLWSLVSEATRLKAAASTDKAPVIDVTKAVIYFNDSFNCRASSKY